MRYNKILNKEEQIKLMAIIFINRANPNYNFDEKDNLESTIQFIQNVIRTTEENDNEGVMKGAFGKFGIDRTNPIPVNGHEYKYERLSSIGIENINGIVDMYVIFDVITNIKICNLYVCIYNKYTSKIIPEGFKIKDNRETQ